jgi:hypothetical protein
LKVAGAGFMAHSLHTFAHPYVFMAWCLINYAHGQFCLYLYRFLPNPLLFFSHCTIRRYITYIPYSQHRTIVTHDLSTHKHTWYWLQTHGCVQTAAAISREGLILRSAAIAHPVIMFTVGLPKKKKCPTTQDLADNS